MFEGNRFQKFQAAALLAGSLVLNGWSEYERQAKADDRRCIVRHSLMVSQNDFMSQES